MLSKFRQAFTLVELVIVISVIALILAGMFSAGGLIQSVKITSQHSQFIKYEAAILRFVQTYDELPGDITIAYNIWGDNCDSNSSYCNGNGDSIIGGNGQDMERVVAWRHLSLANMIEGTYDVSTSAIGGVSVPLGRIDDSMITFSSNYESDGSATLTGYNSLYLVANDSSCNIRQILTSHEMYLIDKKFDDGLTTGKISAGENDACVPTISGCLDSSTNSYSNIDDKKTKRCYLSYATKFSHK